MHEALVDLLDALALFCGMSVPDRGPRYLRLAARRLTSPLTPVRENAFIILASRPVQAKPILQSTVRFATNQRRAVAACLALNNIDSSAAADLLQQLAANGHLQQSVHRRLFRAALKQLVGPQHYLREAREALRRLERKPESFRSIAQFVHALDVLMLIEQPADMELCRDAMLVRHVGGENLSVIRNTAFEAAQANEEHICQVRLAAGDWLVKNCDADTALGVMLNALKHPNPAVQLTAIYSLQKLNDDRAIEPLTALALRPTCAVSKDAEILANRLAIKLPDGFALLRSSQRHDISPGHLVRLHIPIDPCEHNPHLVKIERE